MRSILQTNVEERSWSASGNKLGFCACFHKIITNTLAISSCFRCFFTLREASKECQSVGFAGVRSTRHEASLSERYGGAFVRVESRECLPMGDGLKYAYYFVEFILVWGGAFSSTCIVLTYLARTHHSKINEHNNTREQKTTAAPAKQQHFPRHANRCVIPSSEQQ